VDGNRRRLSIIDDLASSAYSLKVMNYPISIRVALSAVFLSVVFSGVAEDLDAALDAQKKKATRRVYSDAALIENRDIVIPKTLSEEEKALDRDLERLESQLSQQVIPPPATTGPRVLTSVPENPENWLTPSLLDPEDAKGLSSEKNAADWVHQELDRQKEIQLYKKELAEEEALVNKLLREDPRNNSWAEKNQVKTYDSILRNTISSDIIQPLSKSVLPNPLETLRSRKETRPSSTAPLFSPAARRNSGIIQPSFSSVPSSSSSPSTQAPSWRPQLGPSALTSPSGFTSDRDTPKPLPPLKRVRQSLPIHRKDPFSDDFMPEIKTSIWD